MEENYAIGVFRNYKNIGCIQYNRHEVTGAESFFVNIRSLLQNYNRNLASKHIPEGVLVHRFLEEETIKRTKWEYSARLCNETYSYLTKKYPFYSWPTNNDDYFGLGIIGIHPDDINKLWPNSQYKVCISLDSKIISFINFFSKMEKIEYAAKNEISLSKVDSKLPKIDLDPRYVAFNEYEDLIDFLSEYNGYFRSSEEEESVFILDRLWF